MRSHILLKLLNELGKRDKMQGLSSILSLCNNLNNFNYKRAQIQILHRSRYTKNFCLKL